IKDISRFPQMDINKLPSKDISFAREIKDSLIAPSIDPVKWQTLLKQIAERLEEKAMMIWAYYFHEQMDGLIDQSQDIDVDELKKMIRELYVAKCIHWEKYIDPSGLGFANYIMEITGVDLTDVFKTV